MGEYYFCVSCTVEKHKSGNDVQKTNSRASTRAPSSDIRYKLLGCFQTSDGAIPLSRTETSGTPDGAGHYYLCRAVFGVGPKLGN